MLWAVCEHLGQAKTSLLGPGEETRAWFIGRNKAKLQQRTYLGQLIRGIFMLIIEKGQ